MEEWRNGRPRSADRAADPALVALGYATEDELDPRSDYFSRATRSALKELQDAVGLEETGRLTPGQAVFLPVDELRVTKVEAMTGGLVGARRAGDEGVLDQAARHRGAQRRSAVLREAR
ncbi:peptidoglycan-binding domain-containing protein [Streptomyces sp. ZAF1911]|uniref:peptidoglycan-binding domain-containing protein n=1 Tax=Streptomyces sp. ZAF1911 TaxID=2944129 RepID=UPI00237A9B41|nr:peptidoglycan-binding domain-containing protein [Streptomyces sp. ZAF1911]MDD9380507.1 peptidoglycan-binding domain-containing protein [Streptomyces sp. ZAF1911]